MPGPVMQPPETAHTLVVEGQSSRASRIHVVVPTPRRPSTLSSPLFIPRETPQESTGLVAPQESTGLVAPQESTGLVAPKETASSSRVLYPDVLILRCSYTDLVVKEVADVAGGVQDEAFPALDLHTREQHRPRGGSTPRGGENYWLRIQRPEERRMISEFAQKRTPGVSPNLSSGNMLKGLLTQNSGLPIQHLAQVNMQPRSVNMQPRSICSSRRRSVT